MRRASLHITPVPSHQWRAIRPPTPRRATYPSPSHRRPSRTQFYSSGTPSDGPVPALSYWDPDTPSPVLSPTSSPLRAEKRTTGFKTQAEPLLPLPSPSPSLSAHVPFAVDHHNGCARGRPAGSDIWADTWRGRRTSSSSEVATRKPSTPAFPTPRRASTVLSPRFLFPRAAPLIPGRARAGGESKGGWEWEWPWARDADQIGIKSVGDTEMGKAC